MFMIKIRCDRKLGDVELENLKFTAKEMIFLNLKKEWTGDGELHRTTKNNEFYFKDYIKTEVNDE